jgi:two-component system response regulator DevR
LKYSCRAEFQYQISDGLGLTEAAVKKTTKQNALQVCLLSSHSLVLTELGRALRNSGFHVILKQLEPTLGSEIRRLQIPTAIVYVVDAHGVGSAPGALLSNIFGRHPEARIIVVADKFDSDQTFSLLHMGAKGLLTFVEAREQLARALLLVSQGGYWVPRAVLSGFVDSILRGTLNRDLQFESSTKMTGRQREVLDALLQRLSNKEIGSKLNISERTAKFHVSNVLSKFGVRRRSDLILLGYQKRSATSESSGGSVAERNEPKLPSGILANRGK